MSDLKDQIASTVVGDMDVFKKIASKIPGFKGYIERQNRRDADKLVRTTLFNRFRELEDSVSPCSGNAYLQAISRMSEKSKPPPSSCAPSLTGCARPGAVMRACSAP